MREDFGWLKTAKHFFHWGNGLPVQRVTVFAAFVHVVLGKEPGKTSLLRAEPVGINSSILPFSEGKHIFFVRWSAVAGQKEKDGSPEDEPFEKKTRGTKAQERSDSAFYANVPVWEPEASAL